MGSAQRVTAIGDRESWRGDGWRSEEEWTRLKPRMDRSATWKWERWVMSAIAGGIRDHARSPRERENWERESVDRLPVGAPLHGAHPQRGSRDPHWAAQVGSWAGMGGWLEA